MPAKNRVQDLAYFGGEACFNSKLHVGQLYLPPEEEFRDCFRGIFRRRYFANNGPLVRELDSRIAEYLDVRHAVCVTNGTVALMIALKALVKEGEVIVPSFTFPATVQAVSWCGLKPVFCDVDQEKHTLTANKVGRHISRKTAAVVGVHLWGHPCDPDNLQQLCSERGISLIYDAAHGFGCSWHGRKIGGFGDAEVFSFHATKILNGSEGGCIVTNDDKLAGVLRTMRNFHSTETFSRVPLRINGKMTEAQAGMALLGLKRLDEHISYNRRIRDIYSTYIEDSEGLALVAGGDEEESNFQYCVVDVDNTRTPIDRDLFMKLLASEGVLARRYFYPGVHRMPPYSDMVLPEKTSLEVTESLCGRLLQLPIGASVTPEDAKKIGDLLSFICRKAHEIAEITGNAGELS